MYVHTFNKVIDDPTGNSYVENKLAPQIDPQLNMEHYKRSEQQNKELGATQVSRYVGCLSMCIIYMCIGGRCY